MSKDMHYFLSLSMGFYCFLVNLYWSYVPASSAKLQMSLTIVCLWKEKICGASCFHHALVLTTERSNLTEAREHR